MGQDNYCIPDKGGGPQPTDENSEKQVRLGPAIWRNADHDDPIEVVGYAGSKDGRGYAYIKSELGVTGIPADEIVYDPSPEEVYRAALQYAQNGLSIIPIGRNKLPALDKWKPYQKRIATPKEIKRWFANGQRYGIAIVQGAESGCQTIDIEARASHLLPEILDELEQHCPGVPEKLVIIRSAA